MEIHEQMDIQASVEENAELYKLQKTMDEEQKDQMLAHQKKCSKEEKVLETTVMHKGVYYKKVNGKWRYYGKNLSGRGKGWSFVHGYWFYDGYAYTMHKGMWYRYFQEAWHKFEAKLPAVPSDPRGKFRVETPIKPTWIPKKKAKKVVKKSVQKVTNKVLSKSPKFSVKKTTVVKPTPKTTGTITKQQKANAIHSGLPKTPPTK